MEWSREFFLVHTLTKMYSSIYPALVHRYKCNDILLVAVALTLVIVLLAFLPEQQQKSPGVMQDVSLGNRAETIPDCESGEIEGGECELPQGGSTHRGFT